MSDLAIEMRPEARRHRLLFADDHRMMLDAFRMVAGPQYDVEVACSVEEFEQAVRLQPPDLAILDIHMPDGDGIAAARRARSIAPDLKVLFVSKHSEIHYVQQAVKVGASGFLPKSAPANELLEAIDTVVKGGTYLKDLPTATEDGTELTDRQKQVLKLISHGLSAKEIATKLDISVRTAEFHRACIMERLNLHSTAQMTRYAIDHGLG